MVEMIYSEGQAFQEYFLYCTTKVLHLVTEKAKRLAAHHRNLVEDAAAAVVEVMVVAKTVAVFAALHCLLPCFSQFCNSTGDSELGYSLESNYCWQSLYLNLIYI